MSKRPILVTAIFFGTLLGAASALACEFNESQASDQGSVVASNNGSTQTDAPATAQQPNSN